MTWLRCVAFRLPYRFLSFTLSRRNSAFRLGRRAPLELASLVAHARASHSSRKRVESQSSSSSLFTVLLDRVCDPIDRALRSGLQRTWISLPSPQPTVATQRQRRKRELCFRSRRDERASCSLFPIVGQCARHIQECGDL